MLPNGIFCLISNFFFITEDKMSAKNTIQIVGHLGRDPESRFTPSGKKLTKFSVAVNEYAGKDEEGNRKESTTWFNVETWGLLADTCANHLYKGRQVLVEGRMKIDVVKKNDDTRYYPVVVAREVTFFGAPKSNVQAEEFEPELDADGIPF
jgi:single-strand DNA-binding protein